MVYGSPTATVNNVATGVNNIDTLLQSRRWASRNVTFGFTDNFGNDYEDEAGYPDSDEHNASFAPLTAAQKTSFRRWASYYNSVSGLNLVELGGGK